MPRQPSKRLRPPYENWERLDRLLYVRLNDKRERIALVHGVVGHCTRPDQWSFMLPGDHDSRPGGGSARDALDAAEEALAKGSHGA